MTARIQHDDPVVPVEEVMVEHVRLAIFHLGVPALYKDKLPDLHLCRKMLDMFIKEVELAKKRLELPHEA